MKRKTLEVKTTKDLGEFFREARLRPGKEVTLEDLAKRVGCNPHTISFMERNHTNVRTDILCALASALNVKIEVSFEQ